MSTASVGNENVSATMATNAETSSTEDFDLQITQKRAPMVMPGVESVDVEFEIALTNRTQEPVTVKRIIVQSIGGSTYSVAPSLRKYDRLVKAGDRQEFRHWVTARVTDPNIGTAAPLLLRTTVVTGSAGGERRETFTRTVNGHLAIGING
jgi:hypothetical protein